MSNTFRKKGFTQPHFYPRKSGAGFTLIELLVVIAILGLVASVVITSSGRSRTRAETVKLLQYSATIKKVLGADIGGEWRFEDNRSLPFVADSSGNNNNGTWQAFTSYNWVKNDIPELGWAGRFTGLTSNDVRVNSSSSLNPDKQITIEMWVKYDNFLSGRYQMYKQNQYYIYTDSSLRRVLFYFFSSQGIVWIWSSNYAVNVGQWYHIVGTYDGLQGKIFINGKQSGNAVNAPNRTLTTNIQLLRLGFNHLGNLDEVKIYSRGLTTAEIQQHYVEGAKKRGIAIDR